MNYYEKLDIRQDADAAEIREAYKLAARVLHPDLQRDRRLQDLAGRQMRRLSGVVSVLLDPCERARYDAPLTQGVGPGTFTPLPAEGASSLWQAAVRHWFWVLLASMTMGMGFWYGLARGTDFPPRIAAAPPEPALPPRDPAPVRRGRTPAATQKTMPASTPPAMSSSGCARSKAA